MTVRLTFFPGRQGKGRRSGFRLEQSSFYSVNRLEQRTTFPSRYDSRFQSPMRTQSACRVSLSAYYVRRVPDSVDLALSTPTSYRPFRSLIKPKCSVSSSLTATLDSGQKIDRAIIR
jgi:hypothetical protein